MKFRVRQLHCIILGLALFISLVPLNLSSLIGRSAPGLTPSLRFDNRIASRSLEDLKGSRLGQVRDFLYILQLGKISISQLANNEFDLIVMDYAKHGNEESEYKASEIARIKKGSSSGGKKIVLAYMSIGEAENYRFYWEPSWKPGFPSWLGPENPEWEGNYKVRYWISGWQKIIFGTKSGPKKSYLDRIIDQGFDGVYLDIIDAYEFWSSPEGGNERTRIQARTDMYNFIRKIRSYARTTGGKKSFLVFPQNAADIILADNNGLDSLGRKYLSVCNGIGQEDVWYNEKKPQPKQESEWLTRILDIYKANGKLILSIDYVWDAKNWNSASNKKRFNDYYKKAYAKGYVPYAANSTRDLDDLVIVKKGNGFKYDQPLPPNRQLTPKSIELKNSPNFIQAYKMEEYKHHSMGGLAGPYVFLTKPTHPPGLRTHRDRRSLS